MSVPRCVCARIFCVLKGRPTSVVLYCLWWKRIRKHDDDELRCHVAFVPTTENPLYSCTPCCVQHPPCDMSQPVRRPRVFQRLCRKIHKVHWCGGCVQINHEPLQGPEPWWFFRFRYGSVFRKTKIKFSVPVPVDKPFNWRSRDFVTISLIYK